MKAIPIALQAHMDQDATTVALVCRIKCKDGTLLGFTNLDTDIAYDPATVDPHGTGDDWGPLVHRADNGFSPSRLVTTADLGVDNAELVGWISDTGITEQQIRAGLFDYAQVRVYRVNYLDLTQGHEVMQAGTAGETTFSQNGWRTEFRSLTQQLKQPISNLYSLTCTAQFGDARCGKEFTWVAGTVTAVGGEADRTFSDSGLTQADDYFVPGVVEWLTGQNAGQEMEVDTYAVGVVDLSLGLSYEIAEGDTYRIRQDCNKRDRLRGTVAGDCKDKHNNLLNFRGQPDIPVADGGSNMVPGAQIQRAR